MLRLNAMEENIMSIIFFGGRFKVVPAHSSEFTLSEVRIGNQ